MSEPSTAQELRETLRLAAPIALAQFGFVGLSLVDTAVVGATSTSALAGASIGRSMVFAFVSFGLGLSSVIEPLAAQAIAAGELDRAWRSLLRTLFANLLAWPILVLCTYLATMALPLVGVDAETLAAARSFILGQVPGMLFFPWFIAAKAFLQAHGQTTPALLAALAANLVNWVSCNLLVRGDDALALVGIGPIGFAGWSTFGAGLAGSIANLVLFAWLWPACRRHRALGTTPPPTFAHIYALGLPMGLQFLAEIGVFSMISFLAARFGRDAVAAHQVALGLASFTFMGALGVSGATAVRVGRAVGQGRSARRAGMVGILVGGAVMSIGIVLFTLFPAQLLGLFTEDPQVIAIGVPLMRLAAIFQFFDGIQVVSAGALRGAGDVRFPFVANVVSHWMVGLPTALLLGFHFGMQTHGFWIGLSVGLVSVALAMSARFYRLSGRVLKRV